MIAVGMTRRIVLFALLALPTLAADIAGNWTFSAVSVLEAAMVLKGLQGADSDLDLFLRRASIDVVAFDEEQLGLAQMAFRSFGKGRHRAGFNFGDCASNAMAQLSGQTLCCLRVSVRRTPWLRAGRT